jgi:hypothetical protein
MAVDGWYFFPEITLPRSCGRRTTQAERPANESSPFAGKVPADRCRLNSNARTLGRKARPAAFGTEYPLLARKRLSAWCHCARRPRLCTARSSRYCRRHWSDVQKRPGVTPAAAGRAPSTAEPAAAAGWVLAAEGPVRATPAIPNVRVDARSCGIDLHKLAF